MSISAIKSRSMGVDYAGSIRGNRMLQALTATALLAAQGLHWIDLRCAARRQIAGEGGDAHESK